MWGGILSRQYFESRTSTSRLTRSGKAISGQTPSVVRHVLAPPDEAITFANSFSDDPRASSDRTRRSSDTVGSAASIFATRDWLELKNFASVSWDNLRLRRRFFRCSPSASLSSMYRFSSGVRSRNPAAEPILHPFFSKRFLLVFPIVSLHFMRRNP